MATDYVAMARAGRRLQDRRYPAMWAAFVAYHDGLAGVCPFDRPGEDDLRAGWERGLELAPLLARPTIKAPASMTHAARVAEAMERDADEREDAA